MSRDTFAAEDAATRANLHELGDMLELEDEAHRRARISREVLEEYSRGVMADPDKITFLIEQTLIDEAPQYPSLLDIHNGRVGDIAVKCRDHMIDAERHGEALTHRQALGRLEGLAARARLRIVPNLL